MQLEIKVEQRFRFYFIHFNHLYRMLGVQFVERYKSQQFYKWSLFKLTVFLNLHVFQVRLTVERLTCEKKELEHELLALKS